MHTSTVIITNGEKTAPLTGTLRELDIHMTSEKKERGGEGRRGKEGGSGGEGRREERRENYPLP